MKVVHLTSHVHRFSISFGLMEHPAHRTDGLLAVSKVTAGRSSSFGRGKRASHHVAVESENAASLSCEDRWKCFAMFCIHVFEVITILIHSSTKIQAVRVRHSNDKFHKIEMCLYIKLVKPSVSNILRNSGFFCQRRVAQCE